MLNILRPHYTVTIFDLDYMGFYQPPTKSEPTGKRVSAALKSGVPAVHEGDRFPPALGLGSGCGRRDVFYTAT